jgi:hypothetical protein
MDGRPRWSAPASATRLLRPFENPDPPFAMRSTFHALPALLLFLAACGSDTAPKPAEGSASTAAPHATPDVPATGSAAAAAPAQATGAPAAAPKLVAASGTRPAMLDTGIDLSHLKQTVPVEAGPAFPAQPDPAVPAAAAPAPTGPPGALSLMEGEPETHFGEMLEGATASKLFRLKSSGENPLVIERVKPSCGCTAAEIQLVAPEGTKALYELGQPIPVGSVCELEVSINTANRRGPFASSVSVYSNDPASPLRLQLAADVKAVLDVEPMNLDFGTLTSGDTKEGTFTISSSVLEPFQLTLDESRVVEPLTAALKPVDPDASGKSRTWELAVKLGPGTPEGMRRYPLRVLSDVPAADAHPAEHAGHDHAEEPAPDPATPAAVRELNCTVSANVTGLVVATPNFISLGVVRPGEVVERTVKIESLDPSFALPAAPTHRLTSLTGGEFTYANNFTVVIAPTPGAEGKSLDVTLRLEGMPEEANVSFGGMVQIDVGHPTKPDINIRFSGLARPGIPATAGDNPTGSDG